MVRVGGVWYVSAQTIANSVTTANGPAFNGSAEFRSFTFNPAAANWKLLNFNGDYNLATQVTTASTLGNLSVGAAATTDLSGPITGFGMYSDNNGTTGNRRFDSFTIEATTATISFTGTNTWSAAISGDWDFGTANWVNPAASPVNYFDGSYTIFNDNAPNGSVNLTTLFSPGITIVSNNTLAYSFGGSGAIRGSGRIAQRSE